MKEIKYIDCKSIEINFQYKNELITIKSEPFQTLEYIKNKALKKMINSPKNEVYCFYLGVDLTKNKDKKIGDLFYQSKKVTIKLKSKEKKLFSLSLLNNNKNTRNKIKNNIEYKLSNDYELSKKNMISSSDIHKKDFHIGLGDKNKKHLTSNESQKNLPLLKKTLILNNKKVEENKYLCNCKKNKISNYCKNCKTLLCNTCKANEKHKNHIIMHLNEYNYIQDIINYGNNVINEIINNININKNLLDKINIFTFNSLLNDKKNMILKYQKMIDKYKLIVKQITEYLNKKVEEERFKLEIENYNKLLVGLSKEIKEFMDIKNKKIYFNNMQQIFDEISRKEEMIHFFNKDILKYHILNEINIKIKSTIKSIEKIISELQNKDNSFNVDNKYYEALIKMKIIDKVKKEEDKDKVDRKSIIIGGHEVSKNILSKRRRSVFSIYYRKENEKE